MRTHVSALYGPGRGQGNTRKASIPSSESAPLHSFARWSLAHRCEVEAQASRPFDDDATSTTRRQLSLSSYDYLSVMLYQCKKVFVDKRSARAACERALQVCLLARTWLAILFAASFFTPSCEAIGDVPDLIMQEALHWAGISLSLAIFLYASWSAPRMSSHHARRKRNSSSPLSIRYNLLRISIPLEPNSVLFVVTCGIFHLQYEH